MNSARRHKFSTSSGYRYLRELCEAGLLTRLVGGTYILGPRVVELEYVMRVADPIVKVGQPILARLARETGCDALLSNFHGTHIINVLHERGVESLDPTYMRGRQHPLFRGAVAKAILPFLKRAQLLKIYDSNAAIIAQEGCGATWLEFWRFQMDLKRQGYSVSEGELDPDLHGLGVPVFLSDSVLGSLTIVYSRMRAKVLSRDGLLECMRAASTDLGIEMQKLPPPEKTSS